MQSSDIKGKLAGIQRLHSGSQFENEIPCKICGSGSVFLDRVDFNKYCDADNYYAFGLTGVDIDYHRCTACGFLFTCNFDSWSSDDFARFIYNEDYIKVDTEYVDVRPNHIAKTIAPRFAGAQDARMLDYGSGAGVFVTRMRELGFSSIEGYDPFSSPRRPKGQFDIITCFEVIEHTADPYGTLADILSLLKPDGCIILSQTLQPDNILSMRGAWWYLAPRNGHISTYTAQALETLGRRFGLFFHRGDTVYGFAGPAPSTCAQIALDAVGPRFSTVQLHAPEAIGETAIVDPATRRVLWHKTQTKYRRQFRWTGATRLEWQATWPKVEILQVCLPVLNQCTPDFAAQCYFEFDDIQYGVRMAYGALVAELPVRGRISGKITLLTPPPVKLEAQAGRPVGLAVATVHDPVWGPGEDAYDDVADYESALIP